eukprot:gene43982-1397_t
MGVCSYADLPRSMPKTSQKRLFEHAFFLHQGACVTTSAYKICKGIDYVGDGNTDQYLDLYLPLPSAATATVPPTAQVPGAEQQKEGAAPRGNSQDSAGESERKETVTQEQGKGEATGVEKKAKKETMTQEERKEGAGVVKKVKDEM